jgi:hypothetical protein
MMSCSLCKKRFKGARAFDTHRVGEFVTFARVGEAAKHRRCLSVAEMESEGLHRDRHGVWCVEQPLVGIEEEEREAA